MITRKLKYPVQVENEARVIEEITMRRCKVRDRINAEDGGGSKAMQETRLMSILSGQSMEVIQDLDSEDYMALQEVMLGFLGMAPAEK
jgi:hypothetical protein